MVAKPRRVQRENQDEMEKVNNLIVQSEESYGVGGGWEE